MADHTRQIVCVLGAGSWGTALAILLARNGHPIRLWDHDSGHLQTLHAARTNDRYLPDIPFPEPLGIALDLDEALAACSEILVVVPSHAFRSVLGRIAAQLQPHARVMWATKGLETDSGKLPHEVATEVLQDRFPTAVISGPTFAREVALGLPTAVTVASKSGGFADSIAHALHNESFRAYTSADVTGVELGGAVKNVLAIAAGISDGLGFGANARAALITRGLAEIVRLGCALGGRAETFMGLAGLGDLVLTCTDDQSRNRRLGLALAKGEGTAGAQQRIGQVVEGVKTAQAVVRLAARVGVEMPICTEVYRVLYENLDPHQAVSELLRRELKPEVS